MVRAGDRITFVDAHDPVPRRVVRSSYDDSTRTNQIDLDSPPQGLQPTAGAPRRRPGAGPRLVQRPPIRRIQIRVSCAAQRLDLRFVAAVPSDCWSPSTRCWSRVAALTAATMSSGTDGYAQTFVVVLYVQPFWIGGETLGHVHVLGRDHVRRVEVVVERDHQRRRLGGVELRDQRHGPSKHTSEGSGHEGHRAEGLAASRPCSSAWSSPSDCSSAR